MNHSEQYSTTVIAYLGIGSNMGDRAAYINKALAMLQATPGIKLLKISEFFETEPIGGPDNQGDYLNGAVMLECQLPATGLLELLLNIENKLDRKREIQWDARTIDLDILLFGDHEIDMPDLKVPHPLMAKRLFVMEPLAQIAPEVFHPSLKQTAAEILEQLKETQNA